MESVSRVIFSNDKIGERIFSPSSRVGREFQSRMSLPATRILLRSSTSTLKIMSDSRLSSPKTCPFLVAIFQTRNVVFVSRLSLSLSSFQHLANNEIWLWISVCLLIAFRFQQFDISSRRDEIRGTTEKQFSFGKQRLARITRSFIFYANRIILNRNFSTIMYTVYVSFVRAR